jgi:hypothetical protein
VATPRNGRPAYRRAGPKLPSQVRTTARQCRPAASKHAAVVQRRRVHGSAAKKRRTARHFAGAGQRHMLRGGLGHGQHHRPALRTGKKTTTRNRAEGDNRHAAVDRPTTPIPTQKFGGPYRHIPFIFRGREGCNVLVLAMRHRGLQSGGVHLSGCIPPPSPPNIHTNTSAARDCPRETHLQCPMRGVSTQAAEHALRILVPHVRPVHRNHNVAEHHARIPCQATVIQSDNPSTKGTMLPCCASRVHCLAPHAHTTSTYTAGACAEKVMPFTAS